MCARRERVEGRGSYNTIATLRLHRAGSESSPRTRPNTRQHLSRGRCSPSSSSSASSWNHRSILRVRSAVGAVGLCSGAATRFVLVGPADDWRLVAGGLFAAVACLLTEDYLQPEQPLLTDSVAFACATTAERQKMTCS